MLIEGSGQILIKKNVEMLSKGSSQLVIRRSS